MFRKDVELFLDVWDNAGEELNGQLSLTMIPQTDGHSRYMNIVVTVQNIRIPLNGPLCIGNA